MIRKNFGVDDWSPVGVLKNWPLSPISREDEFTKVEYFLEDYGCKFEVMYKILPKEIILKILPIMLVDKLLWKTP